MTSIGDGCPDDGPDGCVHALRVPSTRQEGDSLATCGHGCPSGQRLSKGRVNAGFYGLQVFLVLACDAQSIRMIVAIAKEDGRGERLWGLERGGAVSDGPSKHELDSQGID